MTEITQADIDILKTLPPRKSILNFTEEEKNATQNWRIQFDADIGKKSPFFRADGEWRDSEKNLVPIIIIEKRNSSYHDIKNDVKKQNIKRETCINNDTNWSIQISRKGLEDTIRYVVFCSTAHKKRRIA